MMIVDSLNGTIGQNVILLSFNEDELITPQDALAFYQSLKSESKQSSHYSPVLIDIPEFDENSGKMFLNTICRELDNSISFTEHYPRLTQLIREQQRHPRPSSSIRISCFLLRKMKATNVPLWRTVSFL
jgi:hypothetical protein